MVYISKAALDSVQGVNFVHEDLSDVVTLLTEPGRPVVSNAPQVSSANIIHKWNEQGRNKAGQGIATFAEGTLPNTQLKSPVRTQNATCNVGEMAQVTDVMAAEWTAGGTRQLADGEEVRLLTEALDYETELATLDVLDEMEFEHVWGDSSNPQGFTGGQTDGLYKWVNAYGFVYTPAGGTSASPVAFLEAHIKDAARGVALNYPKMFPDTMLVPPELVPDINGFVGGGAQRPIVQMVTAGPNGTTGLTGGNTVMYYATGFGTVKVEQEPWLSPAYNPYIGAAAVIFYNKKLVKNASLIKLNAEPLARTDTSVKKMVTTTFAQEHRMGLHTAIIKDLKSSIT